MTREEAIHILDNLKPTNTKSSFDAYVVGKAITMAIKALEQEPSGDVISRQAVFDLINDQKDVFYSEGDRSLFESYVSELPPVTLQPKTGHWTHDGSHWKNRYICSECGYKLFDEQTNYCPNCGAKMVDEQESEG